MALSGVHVACGYVGVIGGVSLNSPPAWSETMATAGTTARGAPTGQGAMFEVRAAADTWIAIGAAPDPSQASATGSSARLLVLAGEIRNVFCQAGDKLAWIAA